MRNIIRNQSMKCTLLHPCADGWRPIWPMTSSTLIILGRHPKRNGCAWGDVWKAQHIYGEGDEDEDEYEDEDNSMPPAQCILFHHLGVARLPVSQNVFCLCLWMRFVYIRFVFLVWACACWIRRSFL